MKINAQSRLQSCPVPASFRSSVQGHKAVILYSMSLLRTCPIQFHFFLSYSWTPSISHSFLFRTCCWHMKPRIHLTPFLPLHLTVSSIVNVHHWHHSVSEEGDLCPPSYVLHRSDFEWTSKCFLATATLVSKCLLCMYVLLKWLTVRLSTVRAHVQEETSSLILTYLRKWISDFWFQMLTGCRLVWLTV